MKTEPKSIVQFTISNRRYGVFAVTVDIEDFQRITEHSWYISYYKSDASFRVIGFEGQGYNRKVIHLARFILGLTRDDKCVVDHKNRQPLDNAKSNLRICYRRVNALNSPRSDNASLIVKRLRKYEVRATIDKKNKLIGRFNTREEAVRAAQEYKRLRWQETNESM